MSQYDEFIYTIPKDYHRWGDKYDSPRGYFRGNESMPGSHLNMGFTVVKKAHVMEYPHTHHSVEEYLWFIGADLTKFFDFDCEIEIWLGEDPDHFEKFVITEPTLVRFPPGIWHGPINFKRVGKPVAFSAMYFDGNWSKITRRVSTDGKVDYPYIGTGLKHCVYDKNETCIFCGRCYQDYSANSKVSHFPDSDYTKQWTMDVVNGTPAPRSGKLDQYVYTFPQEYHQWGETFANPRGKFRGITQMPGAKFYGGFSVVLAPNVMEVPHIHHANDEYLWFTGSDLSNFFDFDAEIEIYLGWDPDHLEKIVITEPTVIRVPPHLWHCPINFKRIGKPVGFLPVYPDGDWSKILRQKDENGNDEYIYEAASLRKCVYDPEKICVYCGKCFSEKAAKAGGTSAQEKR